MFKIVVLCAFFASAAAEPGSFIFPAPITQYSTYLAPATTTISKHDTSVIHPSPIQYYPAAPFTYTHFIKKRSPQLPLVYNAPYVVPHPYAPLHTPLVHTAPILPAVAPVSPLLHLIKKRSAPLLNYYAPHSYTTPILSTPYTAPLIPSTHIIPSTHFISQPLAYSHPLTYSHLIKKRSAPLLSYYGPAAYSHQSRFDLKTTHTPLTSFSYTAPIVYSGPFGYPHTY